MSAICAWLSKGKVGVQRGRETAGVPSFLPPRRVPRRSRRPQTANPSLRFSEKLPARKGRTRLRQFECPAQPVQKRSRPVRANPPAAVRVPRWVGAEKEPPVKGEHANAVRMPRRVSAEKKREPSHEGSLKNQFFRFRKYPRYITAAAMLQKYAIIYGTSKIFSK